MKEKFILFKFDGVQYLVKYICRKDNVNSNDIEDGMMSYLDSILYVEYEDVIADVMNSFDGVEWSFVNFSIITA